MAKIDTVEKMKAVAVGGPSAGAEYAAAQRATQDVEQQALSDAANRSGALNAPAAFRQSQQALIQPGLHAQVRQAAALQGAADAYQGQQEGALNNYLSNWGDASMQGAARNQLETQANSDYASAYDHIQGKLEHAQARQEKQKNDLEKQKNAQEKALQDEQKQRIEFARQDAAANQDLNGNTYDTIADVLAKNKDIDSALRYIDGFDFTDENGKTVDKDALQAYTMKALDPDRFAQEVVKDPQKWGRYAK